MPEMTVAVLGLNSLTRAAKQAPRQFDLHVNRTMSKVVLIVEAEAKQQAPPSAKFRRTIHSQVRGMGPRIRGIVGTNDKRGKWFERGTGIYHTPDPHKPWTIVAKNRKALAIPVAPGIAGASARWAVRDLGPFKYMRMQDKKGRDLFRTPKGGSTYKAGKAQGVLLRQSVTIRGMRPRPWLMPAWRNKKPEAEKIFHGALREINRQLDRAAREREAGN